MMINEFRFRWLIGIYLVLFCAIVFFDHSHSNYKPIETYEDHFRCAEIFTLTLFCVGYGWLVLHKSGKLFSFYKGGPEPEKLNNRFYCWLMFINCLAIIGFVIHLVNPSHSTDENLKTALKVWEVSAYLVTATYTTWFWTTTRGTRILGEISSNNNIRRSIGVVLTWVFIDFFAIGHSILFTQKAYLIQSISNVIEEYEVIFSLSFIVIVYYCFYRINLSVIECYKHDTPIGKDFRTMHKYVDRPTGIIFGILLIFAMYIKFIAHATLLNEFFSGAIAFELLLSSIVWSNTETF